jgi:PucR family transcriptional regulator, purine catabolism regulatory protein
MTLYAASVALTVGELVALPHLRLEVVAGAAGLARRIVWAHASDLDAPWAYLAEDELLLANGMGVPDGASRQVGFIQQLEATRIAALGLGTDAALDRLSPEALAACDELRLPLLRVPDDLPFVAIARSVADANQREEHRRLALTTRVYDLVRQAAVRDRRDVWLLERIAALLECHIVVFDAATGDVLRSSRGPHDRLAVDVARERLGRQPGGGDSALKRLQVAGDDGFAIPMPSDEGRTLVCYGAQIPAYALMQHAAAAVAIELALACSTTFSTARSTRRRRPPSCATTGSPSLPTA